MQVQYSTYMKKLDLNSAPRTLYLHFFALLSEPQQTYCIVLDFVYFLGVLVYWCDLLWKFKIFAEKLSVIPSLLSPQGVVPDQVSKDRIANLTLQQAGRLTT